MIATFTPRRTKLKPFNIPKNLVPSTLRVSSTDAWYRDNFPAPSHKEQFVIGCANAPKVKDNPIEKENTNLNNNLQAARGEAATSSTHDNLNPNVTKVKETGNVAIFQNLEQPTPEPMEEVDDDMLSPGERKARGKR